MFNILKTSHSSTAEMDNALPDPAQESLSSPRANEDTHFNNANILEPTLMGLPSELRLLMYTYVFHGSVLSYDIDGKVLHRPPYNFDNAVCRVNKRTRGEAMPQLTKQTKTLTDRAHMAIPKDVPAQKAV